MAESVLVTGATGLVGAALVRRFAGEGLRVVAAARNVAMRVSPWRFASRRPSGPTTSGT